MDINGSSFTKVPLSLWPHPELPPEKLKAVGLIPTTSLMSSQGNTSRVCMTQLEVNGHPGASDLGPLQMWDSQTVKTKWDNRLISPPSFHTPWAFKVPVFSVHPSLSASHTHTCMQFHPPFCCSPSSTEVCVCACVCKQTGAKWLPLSQSLPSPPCALSPLNFQVFTMAASEHMGHLHVQIHASHCREAMNPRWAPPHSPARAAEEGGAPKPHTRSTFALM